MTNSFSATFRYKNPHLIMKNIFLVLFILLFLTSCEDFFATTIKVDPPEHEDQMALHAYIGDTDSIIAISVTKSIGILEDRSQSATYVDDATIEFFKDGQLLFTFDPLSTDERPLNYFKDLDQQLGGIGSEFEIRATHPELGTASAKQIMPNVVSMTAVKFEENAGVREGERVDGVELTFKDPGGEKNYYEFSAYRIRSGGFADDLSTDTNDPLVHESINYGAWLLSDETFDGKEYKITLLENYNSFGNDVVIVVNNITEDWYNYSKSVRDQLNTEDLGLFAEPVSISTNVEGGLGLFGANIERVYPIEF